jgi:PAS domain S-box-containing protein
VTNPLEKSASFVQESGSPGDLKLPAPSGKSQPASGELDLDALGYTIAHDLRAPLRIIDGFVSVLEEDFGPKMESEAMRYLALIRGNAERMNQLIDGILERINRRPRSKKEPIVVESANVGRTAPRNPPEVSLLIVEDSPDDLELILRELRRGGLAFVWRWADTEAKYFNELRRTELPEVILADYSLPQFNALRALELLRERQLDIPFIVVTGTIREEDAVSCMKQGADDYLIKDRYARLVPAIYNALEEKRLRDEKRSVEEAVRQSEQRYRSLVEHSPDAILVTHDGSISYVNDAGVRLFGAGDRQELVGKSYVEFVHPSFLARVRRRAQQMQEGEPAPVMEQQLLRLDGTPIDVEVAGTGCIYDGRPAIQRIVRDVSERRRAQEAARQRLAELTHVTRLTTMGEIVSELAHEINQPLYAVANFAQACSNRLRAPEAENRAELLQWMEQIAAQANRAGEIIRHVGSFVRKTSPKQVTADLNQIVRDVVELLQVDVRRGQAELRLDLAEALPPVCVDRIQIEQVLVNLVRNAVESMADNPVGQRTVLLRTDALSPRRVRVAVEDVGRGLDAAELAQLFKPFFTTKPDGMGMGLAISHSIIEAHGGTLAAAANPSRGLTFQFTLPAGAEDPGHES